MSEHHKRAALEYQVLQGMLQPALKGAIEAGDFAAVPGIAHHISNCIASHCNLMDHITTEVAAPKDTKPTHIAEVHHLPARQQTPPPALEAALQADEEDGAA
jgi:hypothetical protein